MKTLTESSWKTGDGSISYDYSRKCFCWIGEQAHKAMHAFNKIKRDYKLTDDQHDHLLMKSLDDKGLGRVNLWNE